MGYVRSSHSVSSFRLSLPVDGPETGPTVVRLRGEHDIATDGELRRVLACVIGANDAAIVVDLSEVKLISASTLGVIVTTRKLLRQQSRSLTVRSPSAFVRRIIGICGLDDLLPTRGQEADDWGDASSTISAVTGQRACKRTGPARPSLAASRNRQGATGDGLADLAFWRLPVPGAGRSLPIRHSVASRSAVVAVAWHRERSWPRSPKGQPAMDLISRSSPVVRRIPSAPAFLRCREWKVARSATSTPAFEDRWTAGTCFGAGPGWPSTWRHGHPEVPNCLRPVLSGGLRSHRSAEDIAQICRRIRKESRYFLGGGSSGIDRE